MHHAQQDINERWYQKFLLKEETASGKRNGIESPSPHVGADNSSKQTKQEDAGGGIIQEDLKEQNSPKQRGDDDDHIYESYS